MQMNIDGKDFETRKAALDFFLFLCNGDLSKSRMKISAKQTEKRYGVKITFNFGKEK